MKLYRAQCHCNIHLLLHDRAGTSASSYILLLLDAKDGLILVGNNLYLVSIHGKNFAVTPETCLHINYLTKITNAFALEYFILHHLSYVYS